MAEKLLPRFLPEHEQRQSVGVVSVIYHPSAKSVLLIKEKKGKDATDKKAGDLSFPAETRKEGEAIFDTLLGSLAEGFDDTHLKQFAQNIHVSNYFPNAFTLPNNDVCADIAVLLYDGPLTVPQPLAQEEVEPYGWVAVEEIASLPLRSVSREVMSFLVDNQVLKHAERSYALHTALRRQLRHQYFSFSSFYDQREQRADMNFTNT